VIWRFNNKVRAMPVRRMLRVETLAKALVHWSVDGWRTVHDTATHDTTLHVHVVDLPTTRLRPGDRVDLTFYWPEADRWEGADFFVCVK
jgi:glucoamylase